MFKNSKNLRNPRERAPLRISRLQPQFFYASCYRDIYFTKSSRNCNFSKNCIFFVFSWGGGEFSGHVNNPWKTETQIFNTLAINGKVLGTSRSPWAPGTRQYTFYLQKWVGPCVNTWTVESPFPFSTKGDLLGTIWVVLYGNWKLILWFCSYICKVKACYW